MFENDTQETIAVVRIIDRTGQKRFREALNGGEGSAEFVGDVGDEIAADAFELTEFSDVVEHDDGAGSFAGANGGDGGGEMVLAQRAGDDFGFDARLARKNAAYRFNQLGLPDNFK